MGAYRAAMGREGRRRFVAASLALLAAPLQVRGQPRKLYRLGAISPVAKPGPALAAIRSALRELGWIEGRNFVIEVHFAHGKTERLAALAAEVVKADYDVLLPLGDSAIRATADATRTIPIVVVGVDPASSGLVTSLSRPGGNITGVNVLHGETAAKRLELFKQIAPQARRVAIFWDPRAPYEAEEMQALQEAARVLRLELAPFGVSAPADVERVFTAEQARNVDALFNIGSLGPPRLRAKPVLDVSAKYRLPAVFGWPGLIDDGGLLSYTVDFDELFHIAALQVHKILNGARPGDLPIEQPTKFELVINLKTARAYGLTVPQALLLRADRVVQ
jgi:putative tryptophan/tyrosine transport system substrate-binding protein